MDRALRLYRRRIGRCRTENQLARFHIAVENYMTPAEVRHFAVALAEETADSPSRRWITWLVGHMPINEARPVEFERRSLSKSVTRYTADAGAADQKTLIIGFAGHFHRLMSPTPWLLDCLNPALYDVIILRDFSRTLFASGIPGLGQDFIGAMTALAGRLNLRAYRNVVAMGTSGGGVAALLAAIHLRLDRGISVSGQDFGRFAAKVRMRGLDDEPYTKLLASRPHPFPELLIVCGADFKEDADTADALHELVPSRLWKVRNCAQHAVLVWHLMQGKLPVFLAKVLGQSLENRELIAATASAHALRL